MASIYTRKDRNQLWARVKNEHGRWVNEPTKFVPGQEEAARKYVAKLQRALDDKRAELAGEKPPETVGTYAAVWLDSREARGLRSVASDRSRMKHIISRIGGKLLGEVTKVDLRDLVRALIAAGASPRQVHNVYGLAHTMFRDALFEDRIEQSPCVLEAGELPAKVDKDPEWRALATYTVNEVQLLITDEQIAPERRVQYALKAIAMLRHGEVAGLRWRAYDATIGPLGRLVISTSYDNGRTKTDITRRVPVHPTLAAILAAWRLEHWERVYGRAPTPDDLVVPTRTFTPIDPHDAQEAFVRDLGALGLRTAAGAARDRGGHDLRAWGITTAQEHGAHRDLLRVITHTSKADVMSGYTRAQWPALCAEIGKLRVSVLDGKVLALATGFATRESTAAKRWRKEVTPLGLERKLSISRECSEAPNSQIHTGGTHVSEPERLQQVANLATRLADAVLAGENETAIVLAEQVRSLTALRVLHLEAMGTASRSA